jgi:SOS-response transcriptional repressor LexA
MTKTEIANRREENAKNTLEFVKRYWKQEGYGPAYRDIEAELEISAGAATRSVKTLVDRGLLSVEPGVARSIRPLKKTAKE